MISKEKKLQIKKENIEYLKYFTSNKNQEDILTFITQRENQHL